MKRKRKPTVDETVQKLLREMFRRVGEDFDDPEWQALMGDREHKLGTPWYQRRTWTLADEESFRAWAIQGLRDDLRWPKYRAEREIPWFLLQWSWSYSDEASE